MDNTQAYRDAKRHVDRKIGFYIHLAVFITVNTGLVAINMLATPDRIWAPWPLFGWGIGLLFHGLGVFLHTPGRAWKERMIENEMNKRER